MKRFLVPVLAAALALSLAAAAFAQGADSTSSSAAPSTTRHHTGTMRHHRAHTTATKTRMAKVDLNSASKEDLEKLPGVDDATADKIIGARPYTTASELSKKSIVTRAEYRKIRSRVTVKKAS